MRSEAREAAFKIVFADLFHENCDRAYRAALYKKEGLGEEDRAFADRLADLVEAHRDELFRTIAAQVTRFADYRIYAADKAIMLIALAEIRYCEEIPPVVSVSEAAALARKYSTENSASFVNGVLGGIVNA